MLTSGRVKRAFDIDREDPKTRDRYGRHMFGQSLLLARRLVQAGVPIVQANMGHMNNWDTHTNNCDAAQDAPAAAARPGRLGAARRPGGRRPARRDAGRDGRRVRPDAQDRPVERQRPRPARPAATTGRASSPPCSPAAASVAARSSASRTRSGPIRPRAAIIPSDLGATIYQALGVDPASEVTRPARPTAAAESRRGDRAAVRRVGGVSRSGAVSPC